MKELNAHYKKSLLKTKRKFKTNNHFPKIPELQLCALHTKVGQMQKLTLFCSDRRESVYKNVCVTFSYAVIQYGGRMLERKNGGKM